MKILYFAPTHSLYGDNIALLNILRILTTKGVEPLIITSADKEFATKLRELGYAYLTYPADSNFWPSHKSLKDILMFFPRLWRYNIQRKRCPQALIKQIQTFAPDIIHSNNSCCGLGYNIAKQMHIPHVQHIREYGKLGMGKSYYPTLSIYVNNLLHNSNNRVICISKGVKEYFTSERINSWSVIYDGVITGNPIIIQQKEPYFLYVGRLFHGKNVLSLLKGFATYCKQHNNDIILKLAGDGDDTYTNELKAFITTENIAHRVEFLGYCSNVNSLMQKALALFVPSNFEGFGFITTEAMFNGCLVVGRNNGGTKEQFDNGLEMTGKEIGIRYQKDEELPSIMEEITDNGIEYYFPMIQRSQQVITQLYTIEQSAERVYTIYNEILDR